MEGVRVLEAYRARDRLVLGQHYGNSFEVHVRTERDPAASAQAYRSIDAELRSAGGIPNFFGPQRFGEVRPITHTVGRWIVRGDVARAVDVYLIDLPPTSTPGVGDDARTAYAQHRDPARALREFPAEYRFERSILERLARGDAPDRALRALPYELRRLFIHAFQAYLFNRYLCARHAAGVPLDRPVAGDVVVRLGRDGTYRGNDIARVADENLAECTELVARGRASVAGPLVGTASGVPDEIPGRLFAEILAEEEVAAVGFGMPATPELASDGTWRALLLRVPPLSIEPVAEGVWFRFALPKGAYATVVLREFLKGEPTSLAETGRLPTPSAPPRLDAAESDPAPPTTDRAYVR